jgi:hypothetical protein
MSYWCNKCGNARAEAADHNRPNGMPCPYLASKVADTENTRAPAPTGARALPKCKDCPGRATVMCCENPAPADHVADASKLMAAGGSEPPKWLRCDFCHQLGCANPAASAPAAEPLPLTEKQWREKVAAVMQDAWNDWANDTGCFPSDFELHSGRRLSFTAGAWAWNIADALRRECRGAPAAGEPSAPITPEMVEQAAQSVFEFKPWPGHLYRFAGALNALLAAAGHQAAPSDRSDG